MSSPQSIVLIIGTMPPPIGGVSIHLDRFYKKYSKDYSLAVFDLRNARIFFNQKQFNLTYVMRILGKIKIVHIHISSNLKLLIAFFFKLIQKIVIYTHHNSRIGNPLIFKYLSSLCDELIFVNLNIVETSIIRRNQKISEIPAYIEPTEFRPLPDKVENFIDSKKLILSTNCFKRVLMDHKDVYGFDLVLDAFQELSREVVERDIGLILVDPLGSQRHYMMKVLQKFILKRYVFYADQELDFVSLIKRSDVIIRATRSDGDSLTVREGLQFNRKVVASDIVSRPPGTLLFESGSSKDLADKIGWALNHPSIQSQYYANEDFGRKVIDIYRKYGV